MDALTVEHDQLRQSLTDERIPVSFEAVFLRNEEARRRIIGPNHSRITRTPGEGDLHRNG